MAMLEVPRLTAEKYSLLDEPAEHSSSPLKWPLAIVLSVLFAELLAQVIWQEEWQKAILVAPLVGVVFLVAVFDLIGQEMSEELRSRISVRNLLIFVFCWTLLGGFGIALGLFRDNAVFYVGADGYHWFIEILAVAIIVVWACYRYPSHVIAWHVLLAFLFCGLLGIGVSVLGLAGFSIAGGNAVERSSLWRLDLSRGFPLIPLLFAVAVYFYPPKGNAAQLKALARTVILVLLVVLFFTLKRTQWLLFPVAALGIILNKRLLALSMVIVPCLMVIFLAIDVASPGTTDRWIEQAANLVTYNQNWTIDQTMRVREEQTKDAYRQVMQRPLGEGFGPSLRTRSAEGKKIDDLHYVHSVHAYYLLQLGFAGYAALAIMTGVLMYAIFQSLDGDPTKQWMARASFMSVCALIASGFSMVSIHTCFAGLVVGMALMTLQADDVSGEDADGDQAEDDDAWDSDEEDEEEEDEDDEEDEEDEDDEDDEDDDGDDED